MVRHLLDLSDDEYQAYVAGMSDIWAEDQKLYGPDDGQEILDTTQDRC